MKISARPQQTFPAGPRGATRATAVATLCLVLLPSLAAGGTSYYALSPASLHDEIAASDQSDFRPDSGDLYSWSSGCLYAPLHLPDRVTLLGLVVYYWDFSEEAVEVWVYRRSTHSGAASELMASVASTGSIDNIRVATDLSITNPTVDLDNYVYFARVCLPYLYGALSGLYLSYSD